ncbi:NAD(P)-binding protein [Daedaleopsis nitida]|nr:NAD(P)-binding protein [Daedaleopsis nitida]
MSDTHNIMTMLGGRFKSNQIPDLIGRVALVTGGSAGIGYWAVMALAQHNATVHYVSANPKLGRKAEEEFNVALKESGSKGSIVYHQLDLTRLKEVDRWAKEFAQQQSRLDILIANAGIGQVPFGLTDDGLERHFEINNLSHYLIVLRLLDRMKKTASLAPSHSVRIVFQASEMHKFAPKGTEFVSKEEINQERDGSHLYGRSKLGLILLAKELVRRKLADSPAVLVMSVHPGTVDTDLQKHWVEAYGVLGKVMEKFSRTIGKSAQEGAESSLWAATSTDINASNWKEYQGKYFSEPYGKPDKETDQAKDQRLASNFWTLCTNLTQELLSERVE